jgi:hypothetical protein
MRRFCGDCRTVMVRGCTVCGFDNELDDRWCGGCARALPAQKLKVTPNEPPRARPLPLQTSTTAAALLAINRRRGDARPGGGVDVHDQDQLDAIFGAGE